MGLGVCGGEDGSVSLPLVQGSFLLMFWNWSMHGIRRFQAALKLPVWEAKARVYVSRHLPSWCSHQAVSYIEPSLCS